jgi:2,3-bisphosphoglycerate-dependent phosphoglycerate mutase
MRTIGRHGDATTRLVLVRHGEPVVATVGIVGGPIGDTGLTELGRRQARTLAERLAISGELGEVAALYSSTLPRAIETAQLLAPSLGGLEVLVRHELREHDPGELDGLTWTEAASRYSLPDFDIEPDAPLAPGAESMSGFHTRARAALQAVADEHPGATVVVACHGGIVSSGVGLCFGLAPSARLVLPTTYVSMTELQLTARGWRLGRYNDRYPVTDE